MAFLSPIGNDSQIDANGSPLSGGFINTYAAGTATPIATFADSAGTVQQANPIVLNARGLPASPIWLQGGKAVKMVITASDGTSPRTVDNVTGIGDNAVTTQDQWVIFNAAPTFISATSFSLAGDQTSVFGKGRRVRALIGAGFVYGVISSATFSASATTVVLRLDSGAITSDISQVSYGLLSAAGGASPWAGASINQNPGAVPLPSGWFMQGGQSTAIAAGASLSITLATPFPTAIVSVVATYGNTGGVSPGAGNPLQIIAANTGNFSIYNGGSAASQYFWIAIGF